MGRNRLTGHLMAVGIGGILGFLALFLREIGWFLSGALSGVLIGFYVSQRRTSDAGWLLVGGGGVPALILRRNAFAATVDPSSAVGLDTWIMLLAAIGIASIGILILCATLGSGRLSNPDAQ